MCNRSWSDTNGGLFDQDHSSEGGIHVGQRLRAIRRSDSGFTLTELLIVIVILGVLTGIVVFAVGQFSNRGEISACKAAMKTTEVAIESYRANSPTGTLPADMAALIPNYLRNHPTTTNYTIAYHPTGRGPLAGPPAFPAVPAGGVTGDLSGAPVTDDCSA